METKIEVLDAEVELQIFDPLKAAIATAKEECANIVLDYSTPVGIKDAKSFIYKLRQMKASIAEEAARLAIHWAIYKALTCNMSPELAKSLTQSLIDGKIPHVTINY